MQGSLFYYFVFVRFTRLLQSYLCDTFLFHILDLVGVIFKPVKYNNAYRFLSKNKK